LFEPRPGGAPRPGEAARPAASFAVAACLNPGPARRRTRPRRPPRPFLRRCRLFEPWPRETPPLGWGGPPRPFLRRRRPLEPRPCGAPHPSAAPTPAEEAEREAAVLLDFAAPGAGHRIRYVDRC